MYEEKNKLDTSILEANSHHEKSLNYPESIPMKIIARIHTDFPTKFGVPRQSGLVKALRGTIVFEPEYRNPDAVRGLESVSHIWLIWAFSKVDKDKWSPTVRPPRLGGNKRVGVFATRSPFRPNSIGLSCVQLERIEIHPEYGVVLHVLGADLVDNTPIFDIKPYLPYTDSHPEAIGGFTNNLEEHLLEVEFPENLLSFIPQEKHEALIGVLEHDPRPSYHNDSNRIYGLTFGEYDVRFQVCENKLKVCDVVLLNNNETE